MNTRSTPITQLPNVANQNIFVNDQQRNMVMQAQSAISQLQLPQNTQQPPLDNDEDDNTIQEVLNQINSTGSQEAQYQQQLQQIQQMQQAQQLQQMQQQLQMQKEAIQSAQMPPQLMQQAAPQIPQIIQLPSAQQMDYLSNASPPAQQPSTIQDPLENASENGLFSIITSITEDVKFASFIFILFVVVHFIPIDKFLLKYFSLDRIPYYDVLLKGLVAFVGVIVLRKLFGMGK